MKTIIRPRVLLAFAFSLLLALAPGVPARAADTYDIHVIVPLTGGAAFVGMGQKDTLEALASVVNKTGGIRGKQLHFIFGDDQTSPQVAVQLATDVLGAKPAPAVIMGSSLVGQCLAMAPLMASGPVQYCLSPAIHPKAGGYVFSASASSIDQIAAVMRYYRLKGWTKLATLMTTDASGQDGDRAVDTILDYPENKGVMQKVIAEHFNPTDVSVWRRSPTSRPRGRRRSSPGPPARRRRPCSRAWSRTGSISRWRRPAATRPSPPWRNGPISCPSS